MRGEERKGEAKEWEKERGGIREVEQKGHKRRG